MMGGNAACTLIEFLKRVSGIFMIFRFLEGCIVCCSLFLGLLLSRGFLEKFFFSNHVSQAYHVVAYQRLSSF